MLTKIRGFFRELNKYFRADIYGRLVPYVWPYKFHMAFVLMITLAISGLGLLEPWPMKILVDNGLGRRPFPQWVDQHLSFLTLSPRSIIVFAALIGLLLRVTSSLLDIVLDYVKSRVNTRLNLRFAGDVFNHLLRLSFRYHDRTTVGDSIFRVNEDTTFISQLVWSNFRHLITALVAFTGMLWIVVHLDWMLAVLGLAVAPVQYLSIGLYGKLFRAKSRRIRAMESRAQSVMQECLSCLRVVKAFGKEEREQQRVEDQRWKALKARLRLDFQESLFSFGIRFFSKLDRALILIIGGFHVYEGRLTIGELLVVLTYVGQLQDPLETIGEVLQNMQTSLVSAERVLEVLDVVPEIQDLPGARALGRAKGAFTIENVNFGYEHARAVLHDASLTIRPGEVVAIVGPTGAGKTTLASLIVRFYDPDSGRVLLDGHDLRELTVQSLRDNVALVLQEAVLFTGTIRDNIAYARPEAETDEIIEAAKSAGAHEFISALPEAYNTEVGERGVRLSGGERQRIAIARAFLKDAPVLILDEPTSSVDSRTEGVILDALDRLMVGRTTLIIAHRLSTVRCADQIVVLDKGHIVEQGSHDELLSRNGLYAQLYGIQTGAFRQRRNLVVGA